MCGIFGYVSNKDIDTDLFIKPIEKRGPDEKKIFSNKNFKIGATRLSIRDLNNGSQPFFFKEFGIYTALNGEIYNYDFLKNKILKKGYNFKTSCDTELIGPGYHFFGNDFFKMINGMFTIAILNIKTEKFTLVRDRFGIKPIYYFIDQKDFYFSSSAKSIFQMEGFKKEVDIKNLISVLKRRYIDSNLHIFKNIYQVKPGQIVTFSPTEQFESRSFKSNETLVTKKNFSEKLNDFFTKNIQDYKLSDVELCLLISSGVDSNLILILYEKNMKLFNISFEKTKYDETEKLKNLTSEQLTNLNITKFSKEDLINNIQSAIKAFDNPVCDSVIFPMFHLFENISRKYKVTISGEGADEIFGGYDFIKYLKIFLILEKFKLKTLIYWLVRLSPKFILNFLITYQGDFNKNFKLRLLKFLKIKNASLQDFKDFLSVFDEEDLSKILYHSDKEFRVSSNQNHKLNLKNVFLDLMNNWFPNYNCFKLDQLSMGKSLEARVPFLDNAFYDIMNFYKNNISLYKGKKILRNILESKTNKKIEKENSISKLFIFGKKKYY